MNQQKAFLFTGALFMFFITLLDIKLDNFAAFLICSFSCCGLLFGALIYKEDI